MNNKNYDAHRRQFLTAAGTALTSSIFTGRVKGANDRLAVAHIGLGGMGMSNLRIALKRSDVVVKALCDVHEPSLRKAVAATNNQARAVKDFREILADKSIDIVTISTPNHWHAYMTVEACKAGKDVYVEKPLSHTIEEGVKMVQAARKYNRVVQAGTWQRSGPHFQKACELVRRGQLGRITFVRTWNYSHRPAEGFGKSPDSAPPPGFDWDMWLGPAPMRPFNRNRVGQPGGTSGPSFHWYWDYGGGQVTNWGVHWMDIVQMALDEAMPKSVTALGGNYHFTDDREVPDTVQVTFEYPSLIATYENRNGNGQSMFGKDSGILFHGTLGTLFLDRSGYRIIPERGAPLPELEEECTDNIVVLHWENFLDCVRTRRKPNSDVEICHRATTTCHLGNVALRSGLRVDWDPEKGTVRQPEARKFLTREYRPPWRIVV